METTGKTLERETAIDPQERADMDEVSRILAEGKRVTDPELRRRITERSAAVQREILERFGVVDWAVDLIREGRDED
jgi:hypothetical protein